MTFRAERLLLAENREGISLAVAGYLRYECSPVSVERAHNMVARFRNYRALFILKRSDFVAGSVFEVNCDRHSLTCLDSSLLLQQLFDPGHGLLPAHMLFDGQTFERLYRGLGCVLRLQVGFEYVDIVVEPLQVLMFDCADAL